MTAQFAVPTRHLPRSCFVCDPAERASAWRDYERACWADAVQLRGLSLRSFVTEPLTGMAIESEIHRRSAPRVTQPLRAAPR